MTIANVAKYVRSKNAGPFWVTIDIFCESEKEFDMIKNSPAINKAKFAEIYHVEEDDIKLFFLPQIFVIKVSYPRTKPQGGPDEFDMHSGQQYIPVLDLVL
jgi:hypothetical protein